MTYNLFLRYDDNVFWLSPRKSITVSEDSDFESNNYGGGCCNGVLDTTWKFTLYFKSGCTLESAWNLYNLLHAFLSRGCSASTDLLLSRQVAGETPLVYKVTKFKASMKDTILQFQQKHVLSIQLELTLTTWISDGDGQVVIGSGNSQYVPAVFKPLIIGWTEQQPTAVMVQTASTAAHTVAVTLVTPTVSLV